jgi:hypothetical protein
VVTGVVVVVVLSVGTDAVMHATKVFPPLGRQMTDGLFVLATAYRSIYAIVGSYIAALLASDRPMKHALALGFIGVLLGNTGYHPHPRLLSIANNKCQISNLKWKMKRPAAEGGAATEDRPYRSA